MASYPMMPGFASPAPVNIPNRVTGAFAYHPPARKPAPPRRRRPAPVVQSLADQANAAVNQQLNPQLAAQDAYAARQNAAIQGFAQALLGKLQPIAGQVGQDYNQAIQQTGQLSGAAAQYLQQANPSGQVADLLTSANAPQAQIDQLTGQLGQAYTGGAGVLSFLGGAVPGGQLAASKAAAQTEAAGYPALAALRGQQDLAAALGQQSIDRQKLEATRPGLYQAAAQDITTNNLARQRIAQTAASQKETAAYHRSTAAENKRQFGVKEKRQRAKDFLSQYVQLKKLGMDTSKLELSYQKETAAEQHRKVTEGQAQTRIGISQQNTEISRARAANTAVHQAITERQAQQRIGLTAQGLRLREIAAAEKQRTGGISPTTYKKLKQQFAKAADLYYFGKTVKRSGVVDEDLSIAGIDYNAALRHAVVDFSLRPADAKEVLDEFYAYGERGRPAAQPREGGYGPPTPTRKRRGK